jgi:NACalpha-BTF3-like transcription factor
MSQRQPTIFDNIFDRFDKIDEILERIELKIEKLSNIDTESEIDDQNVKIDNECENKEEDNGTGLEIEKKEKYNEIGNINEEEEEADETGLDPEEISVVMGQTKCSRSRAIRALRKNPTIIDAIMELTP